MAGIMALSLVLTVVLEEGFALLGGYSGRRELILVCLANCLTNPPVVFLHYAVKTAGWPGAAAAAATLALEGGAVLAEWLCYRRYSRQIERPFLFSLLANLFSYCSGEVINLVLALILAA